ncbi:uncharacterized protein VNE69_10056 [Vairimorpha necatrix]|uniref:Uncharacterized protein n=1 Tax=Vairimorpha necatrix TaxID=6039 RepID=A0AAX4JFB9_9MICR
MNIFFFIILIQGFNNIYNTIKSVIINKIEKREFLTIDIETHYLRVDLWFNKNKNELNADLVRKIYYSEIIYERGFIKVLCTNKSIENICTEFEQKLSQEYYKNLDVSIVLIYDTAYIESYQIYCEIVNFLKQKNHEKKTGKFSSELYYENIIENNRLWNRMFNVRKVGNNYYYNSDIVSLDSPLQYIKKNNDRFISFCKNFENVYYFFDLDAKEFYTDDFFSLFKVTLEYENEDEILIVKNLLELYKHIHIDFMYIYYKNLIEEISLNKIKFYDFSFMAKIESNTIRFIHNSKEYVYYIQESADMNNNFTVIDFDCFSSFQKIFGKISIINNTKKCHTVIELFYRLMESNLKVEVILERILSKLGTGINILFLHLLLNEELINESELKMHVVSGIDRSIFMQNLLKKLSDNILSASTYVIKICIFIEGEDFINENDINKDIFGTMKKIENLNAAKKNIQINKKDEFSIIDKKKEIDLLNIYKTVVEFYLKDIENFKETVWKHIFKLVSLFTGLDATICEIYCERLCIKKHEVIRDLRLDIGDIEYTNKIISKNLSKAAQEDVLKKNVKYLEAQIYIMQQKMNEKTLDYEHMKKYKEEVKKILNKINQKTFNKIIKDAINKEVEILYDDDVITKLENKLEKIVRKEIRKVFCDTSMKCLVNQIHVLLGNVLSEYEIEEIENVCRVLRFNIKEHIKKNSKEYFIQI